MAAGEILVSDGAIGTQLMERDLQSGECPESFNLVHPEIVEEIARLYSEAGSDIVHTNTFGATSLKLSRYGLSGEFEEINRSAVIAARRGASGSTSISGSIGPTGCTLKPYGDSAPEEIAESYRDQIEILHEEDVDLLCIETMTDLREAILAIEAARSISSEIPVMATMTFDPTPRGYFTIMGINIETASKGLEEAGADIIGSNCGNGSEKMLEIAREFRKHTTLPLLIQPNAGLPELEEGRIVYRETPEFMAGRAGELIDLGVSIIGGCCGTTPEHIRALRNLVDNLN